MKERKERHGNLKRSSALREGKRVLSRSVQHQQGFKTLVSKNTWNSGWLIAEKLSSPVFRNKRISNWWIKVCFRKFAYESRASRKLLPKQSCCIELPGLNILWQLYGWLTCFRTGQSRRSRRMFTKHPETLPAWQGKTLVIRSQTIPASDSGTSVTGVFALKMCSAIRMNCCEDE